MPVELPRDIEAEKAVLGALILDKDRLREVAGIVDHGDFFSPGHQLIFDAMLLVASDGDPIDPVTVAARLSESELKVIGGAHILGMLTDNIGAPSSVSAYARRVKECSVRRRAMVAADKAIKICSSNNIDPSALMRLVDEIAMVGSLGDRSATKRLCDGVGDALTGLKKFSTGDNSDRVQFGIPRIDRAMRGGMIPGGLYLFGAPAGGGKTTVLQNIGVNCARTRGPVLFASPEMSTWELSEREIIRRSGIPLDGRGPWLRHEEQIENEGQHMSAAFEIEKEGLPVHCLDDIDAGMRDICAKARSIRGIKLVIIDYAQEVADMSASVARYLAVGDVGKDAIRLGKELGCPVLIASQVNVLKHGSKIEYSFRESSKLDHKAHVSMIMEVKRSEMPNKHGYFDVESARIFSMKNRSGPMFSVDISYDPATFRIGELEHRTEVWAPKEVSRDDY